MDPLRYLTSRSTQPASRQSDQLLRRRLALSKELSHKDLVGHFGCVNALEFSHGLGNNLASGGDDRRVLLWDVEKALSDIGKPSVMKGEHNSNIFCLAFDVNNSMLFSGGNDEQVIVHDIATGVTKDVYLHEDAVYGLSPDPANPNVFASSCDDGRVLIYDIRDSSGEPFCLANYTSSMHSVMYNPVEPRLLATANAKEGVGLWDVRKPKSCLLRYGGGYVQQSCMSIRFNQLGDQIIALRRRLPPVLYKIDSNVPVCEFDHSGYYNSCTMKSVAFAGDLDQYVISGSDEFNLYMWAIPEDLSERTFINSAHMVLKGHRSIVNQVRFNISNHLIVSSGVEKVIKAWSPFKFPTKQPEESSRKKEVRNRPVYSHEEYINLVLENGHVMSHDYSHESTEEDPRMIAFFDSLVQRELEGISSDDSLSSNEEALYSRIVQLSQSDIDSDDSLNDPIEQNLDGEPNFSPFTIAFASVMASQAAEGNDRFPRLNNASINSERSLERIEESTVTENSDNVSPEPSANTDQNDLERGTCDISRLVRKKKLELRQSVQRKLKDCSAKLSSSSSDDISDLSDADLCETDSKVKIKPTAKSNEYESGMSPTTKYSLEKEKVCRKQVQIKLKKLRNLRQRVLHSDSETSDNEKREIVCLTSTPASNLKSNDESTEKVRFKKLKKRSSEATEDKVMPRANPDLGPYLQRADSSNTNSETRNTLQDLHCKKGKKYSPEESLTGKGKLRDGCQLHSDELNDKTDSIKQTSKHSVSVNERINESQGSCKTGMKCHHTFHKTDVDCAVSSYTDLKTNNINDKQSSKYENSDEKIPRKRSLSTNISQREKTHSNIAGNDGRQESVSPPTSKRKLCRMKTSHVKKSTMAPNHIHPDINSGSHSNNSNQSNDHSTMTDEELPSCSYNVDVNKAGTCSDKDKTIRRSAFKSNKDKDAVSSRTKNMKEESSEDDQPTWSEFKRFKNKVERARHHYKQHKKHKKQKHPRDDR